MLISAIGFNPLIEQYHPPHVYVADARDDPVLYSHVAPLMPTPVSDIVALIVMLPL